MINLKTSDNLLEDKSEALVNTVNCVGIMGKGIALQFKQAYPENFKLYSKACEKNEVKIGKMLVFSTGLVINPRYIINFPTKKHWKEKSRYEYISEGLDDLAKVVKELNIQSIAIPPLGCGNGGLEWEKVKRFIVTKFESLKDVELNLYEPQEAPEPGAIKIASKKPNMTPIRAALLQLMRNYSNWGYEVTKLTIQKLAYFLQELGEPMRLKYEKKQYGPYANNLNHVLQAIDGLYISGYGDRSGKSHISVIAINEEIEYALKEKRDLQDKLRKITELIEGYETPYGLELLATVHWVMKKERKEELKDISASIREWSQRKEHLFSESHIQKAYERLKEKQFI